MHVTFEDFISPDPLDAALHCVHLMQRPVVIVVRWSRQLAVEVEDHHAELRALEVEHGGTALRVDVCKWGSSVRGSSTQGSSGEWCAGQ